MKRLLCALGCAFLTSIAPPLLAQGTAETQSGALLARIQSDKKGLVAKAMNLTDQEAKKFWPLYDKFQRELEAPQKQYTRAVLDYVAAEGKLTDANAKRLAEQALAASVAEAKLRERHFAQVQKVLPAVKAARYAQVENKIQAVQRFEAAKAIPLAE
jgi:Spy/CpxP family protein refolding chaperone